MYTIFTNSYINKVIGTKGFTFPLWKLPFHSEKSHYMIKNGEITITPRVFHFGTVYITEYVWKYLVFNVSMGTVAMIKLFIILCIPIIINAGPGLVCNGTNFSDLNECCTEEYQCGLYQGNCATDSQCKGNLKCGIKNCKLTSNETSYAGNWQKFNCCYNGMSIGK